MSDKMETESSENVAHSKCSPPRTSPHIFTAGGMGLMPYSPPLQTSFGAKAIDSAAASFPSSIVLPSTILIL